MLKHEAKHEVPSTNSVIWELRTALRPSLTALWLLWAVVLLGAIPLALLQGSDSYRIPGWCKMASSLILVLVGWTWCAALVARGQPTARAIALLMTAGIAWGTLGDFFNAGRLQSVLPLSDPMLGGLASFLVGHFFYIAACVQLAKKCNLTNPRAWLIAIVAWELIAVAGWYLVVYRGQGEAALMWAALPYSMVLAGTAGVTAALAWQQTRLAGLALGGGLFLVSDLILGYGIFQGPIESRFEPVWLTYGPGQMLIVFAIGTMVSLLPTPSRSVNLSQ
jgi:uncharacterized membrane protein YhhN